MSRTVFSCLAVCASLLTPDTARAAEVTAVVSQSGGPTRVGLSVALEAGEGIAGVELDTGLRGLVSLEDIAFAPPPDPPWDLLNAAGLRFGGPIPGFPGFGLSFLALLDPMGDPDRVLPGPDSVSLGSFSVSGEGPLILDVLDLDALPMSLPLDFDHPLAQFRPLDRKDQSVTAAISSTGVLIGAAPDALAQTFRVDRAGLLSRAEIDLQPDGFAPGEVFRVAVVRAPGGNPSRDPDDELGSGTFSGSGTSRLVGRARFIRGFLPVDIPVSEGDELALVVSRPRSGFTWFNDESDPYADGDAFVVSLANDSVGMLDGDFAFEVYIAPDRDGDLSPDAVDNCLHFANDQTDSDENGIGDACECGDQNGDGQVDVNDILGMNRVIFGLETASPLCDSNDDGLCDIRDILGANAKIFGAPAYCERFPTPATRLGPIPYLSADDSPFSELILSGEAVLQDFEEGDLDIPGLVLEGGDIRPAGATTDSVDADDGLLDGSGEGGRSLAGSVSDPMGIVIRFDPAAPAGLPARAGIVFTDDDPGETDGGTIIAFRDAEGHVLHAFGPLSDGNDMLSPDGSTDGDRFVGVIHPRGIASIEVTDSGLGFEVDHLQYSVVPE